MLLGAGEEIPEPDGAVEEAVLGVDVQMDEVRVGHGVLGFEARRLGGYYSGGRIDTVGGMGPAGAPGVAPTVAASGTQPTTRTLSAKQTDENAQSS
ncbi:MAG: hypothetical protein Kow0054_05630 [Deferrisoma sp.]